jgi:hypothetical protein
VSASLEVRLSDAQLEVLAERIAVKMGEVSGPKRKAPLSVREAALALNMSQDTVRSRIKAGLIRTVDDLEGLTRIPQAEIQRLQGG